MRNKSTLIVLVFVGVTTFFGCENPECKDAPSRYEFELPVTITPARDTFRVGDTLSVESIFGDMVRNRIDGERYHLKNYQFIPVSVLFKIDEDLAIRSFSLVEVLIDSSSNYNNLTETSIRGEYNYSNNQYVLSYRIVLKTKGVFLIGQFNSLHLEEFARSQAFEGKCGRKEIEAVMLVNDGQSNNIELLNISRDPYILRILERPQSDFHEQGGFAFVVVE